MNQSMQGDHNSTPPGLPAKRKRGRPRKDQSVNRTHIAQVPVPPGFQASKEKQPQLAVSINDGGDGMVGQAVTGVVEAAFDAGYLLSVKIGNSDINLRGVVFKPGHYGPVTAENDVAPHVQMIRRNEKHVHGNKRSRNGTPQNRSPPANQMGALTLRTSYTSSSQGKYSALAAPSVPLVGARGTVVPVVLQPASLSNGFTSTHQLPQDTAQDVGDDNEVHTVEPLAMLPPDPIRQMPAAQSRSLHFQVRGGQQVAQESGRNGKSSITGATMIRREEANKPVKFAETNAPDEVTKLQLSSSSSSEDDKYSEAAKSSSEEPNVRQEESFQLESSGIHEQPIAISQPPKPYPTGRMTELLWAVQENLTESQQPRAEHLSSMHRLNYDENSRK